MFRPAFLLALVCLLAPAPPAPAGALPTPRLLFAEPLTPVMGRPGARETAALDRAIAAYQATGNSEAVEPLLTFLASYPTSPWKPALLANALEAVIAALYLDGGLAPARNFIHRHIIEPAEDSLVGVLHSTEPFSGAVGDYKSALEALVKAQAQVPAGDTVNAGAIKANIEKLKKGLDIN